MFGTEKKEKINSIFWYIIILFCGDVKEEKMKGRNQTQIRLEIFENVKIHYGTIQNTADHKDCGDRLVH